MTIPVWYIPTWSGDYRFEADPENPHSRTRLSIEKPTQAEKAHLLAFFERAGASGWMPTTHPKLTAKTAVEIDLDVDLPTAAGALLEITHGDEKPLWTGIRSTAGKVEVIEAPSKGLVRRTLDAVGAAGSTAVATVTAPMQGCPAPEPCNVRASQVLAAFSRPTQIATWNSGGFMRLRGNVTGRRYFLYHRNAAARLGLDHVLVDAEGHTVCVWHPVLPAEEEALAIKWLVECREHTLGDGAFAAASPTVRGGPIA